MQRVPCGWNWVVAALLVLAGCSSSGSHEGHVSPGGATPMGGLAAEAEGYSLAGATTTATAGEVTSFRFRVEKGGAPVTSFTANHEKELHLILARVDLARELHVHPERAADGTWSVPVTFDTPGRWRAIADFIPQGRTSPVALGLDVQVGGPGDAAPAPQPAPGGQVDNYVVSFTGQPQAGRATSLAFRVARNGSQVTGLRRHLGALAHLVILRAGDLGYLHVHPLKEDGLDFAATFPTAGTYRMFLEFDHDSGLHTAAFDVAVT